MTILISVVIATRNRPELLREAIAAVLAQDSDHAIEVIVVADQSPPDLSLVSSQDRRTVRVIANRKSPGLAGARNSGIGVSEGEFIAFCDDDDYWYPAKLRLQLAALIGVADAGLSTCGIEVQHRGKSHPRTLGSTRVTFEDLLKNRITELHPSTFLLRRNVLLDQIGLIDENVPGGFGEDYDFLLRAAKVHPVINVTEPLVVVRWGSQSYFFRRWATMADGLSWLLDHHPEFEGSNAGSARIRGQIAFAHAAMGHRRAALKWATGAFQRNPLEPRIVLALIVASRALTPDFIMDRLHRHGKGI